MTYTELVLYVLWLIMIMLSNIVIAADIAFNLQEEQKLTRNKVELVILVFEFILLTYIVWS